MNLTDKIVIPDQVMTRQVGDETVILDLGRGMYFGLDPVGTRIWQLLAEGCTLGNICDRLHMEYDVDRTVLVQDTVRLLQELRDRGLVVCS